MNSTNTAGLSHLEVQILLNVELNYCSAAALALLVWHYLLTFDKEMALFWRLPFTAANALFLANRYLTLANGFYYAPWWPASTTTGRCAGGFYIGIVLEYSQYVVWGVFSCLRAYALCRRRILAAFVLLLSLVPVVSNLVLLRWERSRFDTVEGCISILSEIPPHVESNLTLVSRASLIMADAIVVMLTFSVTYGQHRTQNVLHNYGRAKTLASVMCTSGAIYFLTQTIMNVLYLGFYTTLFASGGLATNPLVFLASFVNTMYDTLTAILTTNFLIRLREAAHASTHFSSAWLSTPCEGSPESLRFARADIDSSFGERQPVPIVEHAVYITGPEDMGRARRVDGQTETARQEK